jgi:hypothetical protein
MGVMLYKMAGRPTGREIGRGLGLPFGTSPYFCRTRENWEVAIRWGGAESPERDTHRTLNKASGIRNSGKITTFRLLSDADIPIPEWTCDPHVAIQWGVTYLGRTTTDRGGRGINIYSPGEAPNGRHPLYVQLVPNCREYRLHVVQGEVVSLQRKYLERPEADAHEGIIKNHENGYVFKTPERDLNKSRKDAAIAAVECLGLDFGAVDLVIDENGKEYVLEVNTAPALSPKRIEQYLTALRPLLAAR